MKTKIIWAVAALVLFLGTMQAATIKVNTFGAFTENDLHLIVNLCESQDYAALQQMANEGRCRKLNSGTEISVLDRDGLLDQVRIGGTVDCLWVYAAAISE
jgi:hypothetical protein